MAMFVQAGTIEQVDTPLGNNLLMKAWNPGVDRRCQDQHGSDRREHGNNEWTRPKVVSARTGDYMRRAGQCTRLCIDSSWTVKLSGITRTEADSFET